MLRRGFMGLIASAAIAPYVVRAESIMPVKLWRPEPSPMEFMITDAVHADAGHYFLRAVKMKETVWEFFNAPHVFVRVPAALAEENGAFALPGQRSIYGIGSIIATGDLHKAIARLWKEME